MRTLVLAAVVMLTPACPAAIQVSASGPGTSYSVTENPPSSGVYDVTVTRAATPGNSADGVFTITATNSTDEVGVLTIQSRETTAIARIDLAANGATRIAALGYTSAAEYEAYLNTLNQQQLDAEIARLLAVIAGLGY